MGRPYKWIPVSCSTFLSINVCVHPPANSVAQELIRGVPVWAKDNSGKTSYTRPNNNCVYIFLYF